MQEVCAGWLSGVGVKLCMPRDHRWPLGGDSGPGTKCLDCKVTKYEVVKSHGPWTAERIAEIYPGQEDEVKASLRAEYAQRLAYLEQSHALEIKNLRAQCFIDEVAP